MRQFLL